MKLPSFHLKGGREMTKKQVLLIVLSLGLFGAACLSGAIMAYHVYESKEAGNVFTVGDVKVETVESSWDMNDADHDGVPENAAHIIQNQQIPKSVQAKNAGENEAMVFRQGNCSCKGGYQGPARWHR